MMKISVVLTTKNEEKHIAELLCSLTGQEEPYEVIVIDSDSTDRTCEIVNSYSCAKLCRHSGSRAESMNYGIKCATGDVIAFIGGDDVVTSDWISNIRKNMKKYDIIAGKSHCHVWYNGANLMREQLGNVSLYINGKNISYAGSNMAFKKSVLDKIGLFDSRLISAEDLDLNYRAAAAGYNIHYTPDVLIYYRPKDTVMDFIKQSFWYGYGRKLLSFKYNNILKKHSVDDIVKKQTSLKGLTRLAFGIVGYSYCALIGNKKSGVF